jgi:hypothetical protein
MEGWSKPANAGSFADNLSVPPQIISNNSGRKSAVNAGLIIYKRRSLHLGKKSMQLAVCRNIEFSHNASLFRAHGF